MTSKYRGFSVAAANVAPWECGKGAWWLIGEGVAGSCGPGALGPEIVLSAEGWWWKPRDRRLAAWVGCTVVTFPLFLRIQGNGLFSHKTLESIKGTGSVAWEGVPLLRLVIEISPRKVCLCPPWLSLSPSLEWDTRRAFRSLEFPLPLAPGTLISSLLVISIPPVLHLLSLPSHEPCLLPSPSAFLTFSSNFTSLWWCFWLLQIWLPGLFLPLLWHLPYPRDASYQDLEARGLRTFSLNRICCSVRSPPGPQTVPGAAYTSHSSHRHLQPSYPSCASQPVGRDPFEDHISSGIYITIPNSSKLTVMK